MTNLVAFITLLILSGCSIPCLRRADQGPILPPDFNGRTDAENSAHMGIVEFFDDPTLAELLTVGLVNNQELKIRNQEIQIANNEILARRGAYLPFITAGLSGGMERTSKFTPLGAAEEQLTYPVGGKFPDPLTNTRISADLFWELDIWRKLRNARDSAMQRYIEAIEARNYFVTQLVAETAKSYYELAALDKRLVFLNQTIQLQQQSLEVAKAQKDAARGTELGVQRFLAEVRKNESQLLIVKQDIIEVENKINFLVGRYPQPVDRQAWDFISLDSSMLQVGVPAQLLRNRRDIIAAEREVAASGLDIMVARANFYPRVAITAGVGFEAFNPRYLFDPGAFIANAAGDLVAPLINKKAIQADYMNANARQLQAVYNYQRTILNAFTQVVNSMTKVENYRDSVALKQQQVRALEESVSVATNLFQGARAEYVDVLFSQRDLLEARTDLIETKQQQLSAIVSAYQALGGGFLVTTSGMEFTELFCLPPQIDLGEVVTPPVPVDAIEPPMSSDENLPAPPIPPAPVGGAMLTPTSLDAIEQPGPHNVRLQQPVTQTALTLPLGESDRGTRIPAAIEPIATPFELGNPLRP
ncbi:TolC family protein [Blastopirellula sp. J2-11]|uniref:TolC family protein n=1 Tax=Blastopirellula sp. J2-11 TaxID=2943192 RepID=UPI0021C74285|nr:TolC family protein [Blastopirellula sp. J2-11]UUO04692.1 TolC family protein [Blastopirellula sp. J2-11]